MLLYCIIIADLLGEVPFSHVCWSSTLENQIGRTFGARRQKLPLFTRLRSRQSNSNPLFKFSWIFYTTTLKTLAASIIQYRTRASINRSQLVTAPLNFH